MGASSQRASRLAAASVNRVEAAVLADRVGQRFTATVLELRDDDALIQLTEPAVTANCPAAPGLRAGERITVVLERADIREGSVGFRPVPD
jgi:exoribonuclease R